MEKLDHTVFDPIYEACKDGGYWEGEASHGGLVAKDFQFWVWSKNKPIWNSFYGRAGTTEEQDQEDMLKAYASGEIRDAGPIASWYKLPADVFDELVDKPKKWTRPDILIHNEKLYDVICGWDTNDRQDEEIIRSLYRAGIIRDKGPMPEKQDYTEAFSIADTMFVKNILLVDWDVIKATEKNALDISIAAWEWRYEKMQESGKIIHGNSTGCALCQLYISDDCSNCPVRESTGKKGCDGSPYETFSSATTLHEALDACRDEIEFLKGLR